MRVIVATDKTRALSLLALQQKARISKVLTEVRHLERQKAEAEAMADRLDAVLAQRRDGPTKPALASELQASRGLTQQILQEVARHRDRAAELARDLARRRQSLAHQEHRLSTLQDKARLARAQDRVERQDKAEAAQSPPRR